MTDEPTPPVDEASGTPSDGTSVPSSLPSSLPPPGAPPAEALPLQGKAQVAARILDRVEPLLAGARVAPKP